MANLIRNIYNGYNFVFHDLVDHRTDEWPLMYSPFPGLAILGCYLYFVTNLGPKLMLHREPFKLKGIITVYNCIQIFVNTYFVIKGLKLGWGTTYKWVCEPCDFTNSEVGIASARLIYMGLLVKILDLSDTVFFVLRKKQKQVTFLHIYHHTGMVMLVWGCCRFMPGGHSTSLGLINAFVHLVMYTYYLITGLDESKRESLWWKKYLTQLQIVQFVVIAIHNIALLVPEQCEYPRWPAAILVPQNVFMAVMFTDFYIKSYVKRNNINNNIVNEINSNVKKLKI